MKKLTIALSIIVLIYVVFVGALYGYIRMTESDMESNQKSLAFYDQEKMSLLTSTSNEEAEKIMMEAKMKAVQTKISENQSEYIKLLESYQNKKFLLYKLSFGIL